MGPNDDPIAYMRGGSYAVIRRIRTTLDAWDATSLGRQEATIGRRKLDGAPPGGHNEHDAPDLANAADSASPAIPADAHIRLASATVNHGIRILRRSYNYVTGLDPTTNQLDAGLVFISYQQDPARQFVPIQRRLAQHDALNEHLQHAGSAVFAFLAPHDRAASSAQSCFRANSARHSTSADRSSVAVARYEWRPKRAAAEFWSGVHLHDLRGHLTTRRRRISVRLNLDLRPLQGGTGLQAPPRRGVPYRR